MGSRPPGVFLCSLQPRRRPRIELHFEPSSDESNASGITISRLFPRFGASSRQNSSELAPCASFSFCQRPRSADDLSYRDQVAGLSFCDDGTLWVASSTHGLARVTLDRAALAAGADWTTAVSIQPVPLPASGLLMLEAMAQVGCTHLVNTGTGWPFGGPQITPNEAAGKVIFQKYKLEGGEKLAEKVVVNDKKQKDVAPLGCLMAYSAKGEKLNLTSNVQPDGTLNLQTGFSGSLDPRGWRLASEPGQPPRFVRASDPLETAAHAGPDAPTAPGDELWDDRFNVLGVTGYVRAIAVSGDDVYVGGEFSAVGGVAANNIAKWNSATGTWSALGSGVTGYPQARYGRGRSGYCEYTALAAVWSSMSVITLAITRNSPGMNLRVVSIVFQSGNHKS